MLITEKLRTYKLSFWLINLFQMLEIFAYQNVILQMSIYIAQKDVPGGLHWDHTTKGIIFFVWALSQRFVPIISGYYSDKYGYKLAMLVAYILTFFGYWILGTQTSFTPFLLGAVILGIGSGIFKPSIQGALSHTFGESNHTFGWSIYFMLFNLAVLLAIPFSNFIKSYGWEFIFLASASMSLVNFILTYLLYKDPINKIKTQQSNTKLFSIFKLMFNPRILWFLIIMSGFTIIYMQFYETLPNFIYDWVDTSSIASALSLPSHFLMDTSLGVMISYEWLYSLNTLMIVVFVSIIGWLLQNYKHSKSIIIGVILATLGLTLCGNSTTGIYFIVGIVIYTFGEMIVNPNFTSYLESLAGDDDKATVLSFLNISFAFGLGGGSLLGGWLYNMCGDKANLAVKYLADKYSIHINSTEALDYMRNILNLNDMQIRDLLWNKYNPGEMWYVFLVIGLISSAALFYYSKKYNKSK